MSQADRPVALVLAASRGIGAAVSRRLASGGYRLVLMSRGADVHTLAAEVGGVGVTGSVTEAEDLDRASDTALASFGRIDGVVCNTGHPPRGDLLSIDDAAWHAGLDLALLHVVRTARRLVPAMVRQGGGAFVNVSTYGAVEPTLDYPVSCVVRAGLGAFAKLFSERYGGDGIRMNTVLSGFISSHESEAARRVPLGRAGRFEDVADVVAFLLSDDARYVTGQSVRVDGGLTRSL